MDAEEDAPRTWDDWSRRDRDRRERAALKVTIRQRRAEAGFAHEAATLTYRRARRAASLATAVVALPLAIGWGLVLRARDASIAAGLGDRSFAPAGFALLLLTLVLAVVLLRVWGQVLSARPGPLQLEVDPDSPDAPRHSAFDGSQRPPRRW